MAEHATKPGAAETLVPAKSFLDRPWVYPAAFAGIILAAFLLRLFGIYDDLWLDEIWSWDVARKAGSVLGVFAVHHDNNHWLNTIWMCLMGQDASAPAYRILSLVTGALAVAAVGLAARAYGRVQALLAMVFAAASFALIQYSTEARGYGPAVCFAAMAFWLMGRFLRGRRWPDAVGFCACVVLGTLSHLAFLYIYVGLAAWSAWSIYRRGKTWLENLPTLLIHAPLAIFFAALYFGCVRGMQLGGKNENPLSEVLIQLTGWMFGTPLIGQTAVLVCLATAGIAFYEIYKLFSEGSDHWVFYLVAVFVGPTIFLMLSGKEFLFPRYFLLVVPFLFILVARFLARWLDGDWLGKGFVAALLLAFVGSQAYRLSLYYRYGKGQYVATAQYIAQNTAGPVVTVGGDHDFRNPTVLNYHWAHAKMEKELDYFPLMRSDVEAPQWLLFHNTEFVWKLGKEFKPRNGATYRFVRVFPCYGMSGFSWFVYRRVD